IRIGHFIVRSLGTGRAGPSAPAADWNPLASRPPDQDPLPRVSLEVLNGTRKNTTWSLNRVLAVVGRSSDCQVRVAGPEVSRSHCTLLRPPLGLWVIDLLARKRICVNGVPVRWARLQDRDELGVGALLLRVRYHVSGLVASPVPLPGSTAEVLKIS